MNKLFNFFGISIQIVYKNGHFHMMIQGKPDLYTIGVANQTEDMKFVPFFDIDNIYYEVLKKYVVFLQENFKLGPCIILCTSGHEKDDTGRIFGNYCLVFTDKLTYTELSLLLDKIPSDANQRKMAKFYKYKNWVVRIIEKVDKNRNIVVEKPFFIEVVNSKYNEREKSKAHIYFFIDTFLKNYKYLKLFNNIDDSRKLYFTPYNTNRKRKIFGIFKKKKYKPLEFPGLLYGKYVREVEWLL